MKKVKNLKEIIEFEKNVNCCFNLDYNEEYEKEFIIEIKKLFKKFNLNENDLYNVYMFEEDDIEDEEYMLIKVDYKYVIVYMCCNNESIKFFVFDK